MGQLGCVLFFSTGCRFFFPCFTGRSDVDVFCCGDSFSMEGCCFFFFLFNSEILYININPHDA